jgi:hypothetical protein
MPIRIQLDVGSQHHEPGGFDLVGVRLRDGAPVIRGLGIEADGTEAALTIVIERADWLKIQEALAELATLPRPLRS